MHGKAVPLVRRATRPYEPQDAHLAGRRNLAVDEDPASRNTGPTIPADGRVRPSYARWEAATAAGTPDGRALCDGSERRRGELLVEALDDTRDDRRNPGAGHGFIWPSTSCQRS